jgi:peroxiredoxin
MLLNEHLDDFNKHNIKLISISTDSLNQLKQYQKENGLEFPQISDRGAKIAQLFDVDIYDKIGEKNIKSWQAIPSKFLIDKSKKIVWRYMPESKPDRPEMKIIMNAIKKNINPK